MLAHFMGNTPVAALMLFTPKVEDKLHHRDVIRASSIVLICH
jgi:hypothetical protein